MTEQPCTAERLVERFNACTSPKEALALLADIPVPTIAEALYNGAPDPTLLGGCIGHHAPLFQALAQEYPLRFASWGGMGVVAALRNYLWRFRLPGESAQIERVLAGFSSGYFLHNHATQSGATGAVDPSAVGYYVRQPAGPRGAPCCVHCGVLEGQHGQTLQACEGCGGAVHFCRRCRKLASKRGHAVAGNIGYGRACVAALGLEADGGQLQYRAGDGRRVVTEAVSAVRWVSARGCPAKSADAVMVLCYAVVMLTTNLHNPKVKSKMQLHEFLQQNQGVNDGGNFPGDYLAEIYANIEADELKVMPAQS